MRNPASLSGEMGFWNSLYTIWAITDKLYGIIGYQVKTIPTLTFFWQFGLFHFILIKLSYEKAKFRRLGYPTRNDWGTSRPCLLPFMAVKSKPPALRVVVDSECGKLKDPHRKITTCGQPGCHGDLGSSVFFAKIFRIKLTPDDNLENLIP